MPLLPGDNILTSFARAVRALPDAPRRALRLHLAGLTPLEQAIATGRSPAAVDRDLSQACTHLSHQGWRFFP